MPLLDSFKVDHTKMTAVRVTVFDLPNVEESIHTLFAGFMRDNRPVTYGL